MSIKKRFIYFLLFLLGVIMNNGCKIDDVLKEFSSDPLAASQLQKKKFNSTLACPQNFVIQFLNRPTGPI